MPRNAKRQSKTRHRGKASKPHDSKAVKHRTDELAPYKRATFYVRPDQLKGLKLKAVEQERDYSDAVREAIDEWLQRY